MAVFMIHMKGGNNTMQSEHFIFNGIHSADMEQYLVRTKSGAIPSPYFGGQNIQESYLKGKLTPYHFNTTLNPIKFTIEISPLEKEWTPQRKNELGKWLLHDTYKSFQTADDLGKYYYAIVTGMPQFELYGNKGFIPITFRTNSAFAWSPIYIEHFDLSENIESQIITLNNLSNINKKYRPKFEFKLIGGETNVKFKNLSNNGQITEFSDLLTTETISIDFENEIIESSLLMSNPFSKFNKNWLELVYGVNQIEVNGKIKLWVKSQFPILQ